MKEEHVETRLHNSQRIRAKSPTQSWAVELGPAAGSGYAHMQTMHSWNRSTMEWRHRESRAQLAGRLGP